MNESKSRNVKGQIKKEFFEVERRQQHTNRNVSFNNIWT